MPYCDVPVTVDTTTQCAYGVVRRVNDALYYAGYDETTIRAFVTDAAENVSVAGVMDTARQWVYVTEEST